SCFSSPVASAASRTISSRSSVRVPITAYLPSCDGYIGTLLWIRVHCQHGSRPSADGDAPEGARPPRATGYRAAIGGRAGDVRVRLCRGVRSQSADDQPAPAGAARSGAGDDTPARHADLLLAGCGRGAGRAGGVGRARDARTAQRLSLSGELLAGVRVGVVEHVHRVGVLDAYFEHGAGLEVDNDHEGAVIGRIPHKGDVDAVGGSMGQLAERA